MTSNVCGMHWRQNCAHCEFCKYPPIDHVCLHKEGKDAPTTNHDRNVARSNSRPSWSLGSSPEHVAYGHAYGYSRKALEHLAGPYSYPQSHHKAKR